MQEEERLLEPSLSSASADDRGSVPFDAKQHAARTYRAWLTYSLAAEVFSVVCQGLFLSIALEQYARENGRVAPDHGDACVGSLPSAAQGVSPDDVRCDARIWGRWIDSAAFSLYAFSFAVAALALVVITLGAAADDPAFRVRLLSAVTATGSLSCIAFLVLPSTSPLWWISAPLSAVANISFGLSMVALNAFLPSIARGLADSVDHTVVARTTARVSARGIAFGYSSGCLVLLACLVPLLVTHGSIFGMRIAITGAGCWWLVLGAVALGMLPRVVDPPVVVAHTGGFDVWSGWRGLGTMLNEMPRLPETFKFLLAWLLLSDAFTTVTSTAVLYGKTSLHMSTAALIVIGILAPAAGIAGAIVCPRVAHHYRLTNLHTLIWLVSCALAVPVYGCFGLLPFVRRWGFGGLTASWEMFVMAIYFGFVYGGFQSYSRAVFSSLIPANQEARWFGLYSITDKSASFIGPLIVGLIADATGSLQLAFVFLVVALATPLPILAFVLDGEKGRRDAELYMQTPAEA